MNLKRKLGDQKKGKSEQVWVRRPPMLIGAGVKPPPTELPYLFISYLFPEEKSKGRKGKMELVDDIQTLKGVSIWGLEKIFGRERMESLVKFLYEHFSIPQMMRMLCRSYGAVYRWLRRYEVPLRPRRPLFSVFYIVPTKAWLEPFPRFYEHEGVWVKEYTILPSEKLAYLFGYIVGGGCATPHDVRIAGKKHAVYGWKLGDAVHSIAREVAGELTIEEKKPTVTVYYQDKKTKKYVPREKADLWWVYIFSSALAHTFGFQKWYKRLMKTMTEPKFLPPFLAGLWDEDGSFGYWEKKPRNIVLSQEAEKKWWMEEVRKALEKRGIKTSLTGPRIVRTRFFHDEEAYEGETTMYTLSISKGSWQDFIEMIVPYQQNPLHKERAREFLEFVRRKEAGST